MPESYILVPYDFISVQDGYIIVLDLGGYIPNPDSYILVPDLTVI